ncbi:flagellar hook-basal body protein [Paraburkholderia sp. IW21]|uniref:flagellar hook-basal body protein n=1 Tax=Paraburkholderia sp. IW21 TaxID=3242488 RepID=UPI0035214A71
MDNVMLLATRLISLQTRRVEIAGENVANVATPGYKREIAFEDALAAAGADHFQAASIVGNANGSTVATDFSAGKLVHTGDPFDLSITGAGFFEVATTDGPAYTRLGSFQRDADGRLVTAQGWPLQGSNGDVRVNAANWHVERDGTVIDNGNTVAVVRIVDFDDTAKLRRTDGGLFVSDGAQAADVDRVQVSQGYIESSNATLPTDMMQMMEAMRRVESGQKLVHAYDDMMGSVMQRLGEM